MRPCSTLPAIDEFATSSDVSHTGEARLGSTFAWMRKRAPVHRHPDVVPREHHHGDAEDRRVEELLAHALRKLRDRLRAARDDERADDAEREAAEDEAAPSGDPARRRAHDADDERGLEDFAEDDERGAEHGYFATTTPFAVFSLYSPTNLYSPALRGPT